MSWIDLTFKRSYWNQGETKAPYANSWSRVNLIRKGSSFFWRNRIPFRSPHFAIQPLDKVIEMRNKRHSSWPCWLWCAKASQSRSEWFLSLPSPLRFLIGYKERRHHQNKICHPPNRDPARVDEYPLPDHSHQQIVDITRLENNWSVPLIFDQSAAVCTLWIEMLAEILLGHFSPHQL